MQILDDAEWMVHERLKADDRYIEPWPGRDEHHDRRIGDRRHSDVTGGVIPPALVRASVSAEDDARGPFEGGAYAQISASVLLR